MSHTKRLLRGPIARLVLAGALALFVCVGLPHEVRAEWQSYDLWFGANEDGIDYIEKFVDANDPKSFLTVYVFKDGLVTYVKGHDSNPNPADSSSGPKGDLQSRIDLAKQHGGGHWVSEREFWDSPLGQSLTSKGKGPGPVINPADDDVGGGPGDPSKGKEKLGAPLIIDKTGGLGSGKGGGFQFNGGSPADQLKKPGGPGGNQGGGGNDDDDDKGSHKPPPGTFFGPADLVDPLGPPIARTAKNGSGKGKHVALGGPDTKGKHVALGGPDTKTGKGKSGEGFLPYIEKKSLKKNGGNTKRSERGVIAIIKPGEKTGIGDPNTKGKGKGNAALGGPDTKSVGHNTFGNTPGGHSSLNFRMPGGSMSGIGSMGAGSFRVR